MYTLEKVLKLKRDAESGIEFLDVVMKTLDEKPSFTFWTTLAKALETQTKEAAKSKLSMSISPACVVCANAQPPHGSNKLYQQATPASFVSSTISSLKSPCTPKPSTPVIHNHPKLFSS